MAVGGKTAQGQALYAQAKMIRALYAPAKARRLCLAAQLRKVVPWPALEEIVAFQP